MIHGAIIEVTCDRPDCPNNVRVALEYKHYSYSETGRSDEYDTSDKYIEATIAGIHDWVVVDGKHYCCEACREGNNK